MISVVKAYRMSLNPLSTQQNRYYSEFSGEEIKAHVK